MPQPRCSGSVFQGQLRSPMLPYALFPRIIPRLTCPLLFPLVTHPQCTAIAANPHVTDLVHSAGTDYAQSPRNPLPISPRGQAGLLMIVDGFDLFVGGRGGADIREDLPVGGSGERIFVHDFAVLLPRHFEGGRAIFRDDARPS